MIDISKGRYWDEGIKLVSGCTKCSPGCNNCWSLAMENRFYQTEAKGSGSRKVEIHPDRLRRFNTRQPKVFAIWNDLFSEAVSDDFRYAAYRAMIINKQNTYLCLTKRPQMMAEYLSSRNCFAAPPFDSGIWHGLTVCNQQEADEKIPIFLQVPGKKFLSIEPMLGPIDLQNIIFTDINKTDALSGTVWEYGRNVGYYPYPIQAVILGGETGPGARPMHPDWVRSVRDQCVAADVPYFFKGWGKWRGDVDFHGMKWPLKMMKPRVIDGRTHDDLPWGLCK